jgi:hypothetical protein
MRFWHRVTKGIKFQSSGVTDTIVTYNGPDAKTANSFVDNFDLIGHGPVPNTQVTVNTNGRLQQSW